MAPRYPKFSFEDYLLIQCGIDEPSGFYLTIKLFQQTLLRFKCFDFTYDEHNHSRINYLIHKLNIEERHYFSYYERHDAPDSQLTWRYYYLLQGSSNHEFDRDIPAYEIAAKDRQYLKQRECEYPMHQRALKRLATLATFQKSTKDPYILYSTDALLFICLPMLAQLEQLIEEELASVWWRQWFAKAEHLQHYINYCHEHLEFIQQQRHAILNSFLLRLQTACDANDFVNDDVIYYLCAQANQTNPSFINLVDFPVRREFSYAQMLSIDRMIEAYGNSTIQQHYQLIQRRYPTVFESLNDFYLSHQQVVTPKALQSLLPYKRYEPAILCYVWNVCYDFFYQSNQRKHIVRHCLQLPGIIEQIAQSTNPLQTSLIRFFWEHTQTLQLEQIELETQHKQWIFWLHSSYRKLYNQWQALMLNAQQAAKQALIYYCLFIADCFDKSNIVNASTQEEAQEFLVLLQFALLQLDPTTTDYVSLSQLVDGIQMKLEQLKCTPSQRHQRAHHLIEKLLAHQNLTEQDLVWLMTFSQHPPFDCLDYPHDEYALSYQAHEDHFSDMVPRLKALIDQALNQPPNDLMVIQQASRLLRQIQPELDAYANSALAKIAFKLTGNLNINTITQLEALRHPDVDLGAVDERITALIVLLQQPTSHVQQEEIWIHRYALLHQFYQYQLLQDIQQALAMIQQHAPHDLGLIAFYTGQHQFVRYEAMSIDKLEAIRQECFKQNQQWSTHSYCFSQPFNHPPL